jgi:hypothetical protein
MAALIVSGCSLSSECSEAMLKESTSPDGKYIANLFQRNCGATTSFTYHVNLRNSSEKISYDWHGRATNGEIFLISNHSLSLTWKDEKTLVIMCDNCSANDKPAIYKEAWENVNISYQRQ